ncbi:MAG: type II toxin-antitoxin system Phd/YefM family antitoxin [Actinobacteria bacterium]|nr:type II toxin-antitoxin system Phd/YefM family antitoxin [Actinomycetota bacterium]MBU1944757.1 type II toxin-antitoxin system Phd/YefM family antitoxin [Actinomycetota bacterium]MBU2688848.1 type II toxin-antitoxin system Phd/YefM family antitoxin [Actinomycetota bacterium]
MKTIGIGELKARASQYVRNLKEDGAVIVTNNGRPVAALVPLTPDDLEDFIIAHSTKVKAAVRRSLREIERGRAFSLDEVYDQLVAEDIE